jgi:4-alpha-glucanotransferase
MTAADAARNPPSSLERRRGGVLCHITSLPGSGSTGTLGSDALRFLDFMQRAGLSIWQMLPLNPPDLHRSPYHSASLFALDETLLDPALHLDEPSQLSRYARTHADAFDRFISESAYWLDDYCRFCVCRDRLGADWSTWPVSLRRRDPHALAALDTHSAGQIERLRWAQFATHHALVALRREAAARGVLLFGDLPLYPAYEGADVWAHPDIFLLDETQRPRLVAGVPPDYFSVTGQLWGNPIYAWDALAASGFAWWIERLEAQLELFDLVRIDHFRGLQAYWGVPADADSAGSGAWYEAPGAKLLSALQRRFEPLAVVAEDLGVITPEVDALREAFGLPGMRVLQFAFSGDPNNPHLPANYRANTVAYTGTHDNDTTLGWYRSLEPAVASAVGRLAVGAMPWALIEVLCRSTANTVIVPMQDLLGLDGRHRMNTPGVASGNWRWRFEWPQVDAELAPRIRTLLRATGRA